MRTRNHLIAVAVGLVVVISILGAISMLGANAVHSSASSERMGANSPAAVNDDNGVVVTKSAWVRGTSGRTFRSTTRP